MTKLIIISLILAISQPVMAQEEELEQEQNVEREDIEWCDIWIPSASDNDKPRVLLIGDSITNGYYDSVNNQLQDEAYCAKFTTSACVADPAFHKQLEVMFSEYEYAVIHFNNGLHGFGYTEEEYRAGYEKALNSICQHAPNAALILALSTPLQSTSEEDHLNPRIEERNSMVRELADRHDAEINDLHSISTGHPEHYTDPYHFKGEAIELQSEQVVDAIKRLLADEQENAPEAE
ncbi:MAG: SGNH/GDSL hydrolase family protein [Candidatus Hydrogenedentota bacterium]